MWFTVPSFEHRLLDVVRVPQRLPFRLVSFWTAAPGDGGLWTRLGRWARTHAIDWQNLRWDLCKIFLAAPSGRPR